MRLCVLVILETIPIESQQYDCPNLSGTRMIPMTMPNWMGKCQEDVTLYNESQVTWEWERWSSPGKSTPTGCPVPNSKP